MKNINTLILIIVTAMLFSVSGCGEDSIFDFIEDDDAKTGWCTKDVDESTATEINNALLLEITSLFGEVGNSSTYPNYENSDNTVSVKGEYTTYPYYFKFIFSFKNYTGSYLDISSGKITYIDEVDDLTSIHYWRYQDGHFDITYNSEEYEVWWDFAEYNEQGVLYYEGEFTVCKSQYQYSGSSR